jgi:hypothetical protein
MLLWCMLLLPTDQLPDLAPLKEVVKAARAEGLQLMMTLTNGPPDYGGYWQYVR